MVAGFQMEYHIGSRLSWSSTCLENFFSMMVTVMVPEGDCPKTVVPEPMAVARSGGAS